MILDVDDNMLEKIAAMIDKAPKKRAATLERIPGIPYTREGMIVAADEAVKAVREGRYISQQEMGKRVASWGRQ